MNHPESGDLYARMESTAGEYLRKWSRLNRETFSCEWRDPNLPKHRGDKTVPSAQRCWIMDVDKTRRSLSDPASENFVHPYAADLIIDAVVHGKTYRSMFIDYGLNTNALKAIVEGAVVSFVLALTNRKIPVSIAEYREAPTLRRVA